MWRTCRSISMSPFSSSRCSSSYDRSKWSSIARFWLRGDDDDLLDARRDRLFDRVLDDRLVDEGQHLLGLRLGRRQEASSPAGGRKDSFANAHRTSGQRWAR